MKFALSWIAEWKSPDFQSFQPLEFWLLLFILGALLLGAKLPVTRIAILLLLIQWRCSINVMSNISGSLRHS
jgi:hypothetical protein